MDSYFLLDEEVFHDAPSYFEAMIKHIDEAKRRICLEFYTIEDDALGRLFMDKLICASNRGISVSIITDGVGSKRLSKESVKKLQRAGVQFEFFNGLASQLSYKKQHSLRQKVRVFLRTYLLLKINKRNHRKLCVIDDVIAFVGSANISDVHVKSTSYGPAWRDTGFLIRDQRVEILREAFEITLGFIKKGNRATKALRGSDVQINFSPISRRKNLSSLKKRIANAKERIWITNPYFVPTPCILKELLNAQKRGVEVSLLTGEMSDHKFFPWINSIFYRPLRKAGADIFLYQPSVLHSKVTIIDDCAISGSSNLNHRSLYHDLELDLFISNPKTIEQLSIQFKKDLKSSRLISSSMAQESFQSLDYFIPIFRMIKSYF